MEKAAIDIFIPVMESAIVYAGHYCKSCNREIITSMDMCYGWRHAARTTLGNKIGSFFPDVYNESDDSSESSDDSLLEDENETEFTRYTGDDETCKKMNENYDTWEEWIPETPAERAIKNAIDSSDGRIFSE